MKRPRLSIEEIERIADEIIAQRRLKRARPTKRGRPLPAALAARKIASRGTSE
jgi:hypothetical protein